MVPEPARVPLALGGAVLLLAGSPGQPQEPPHPSFSSRTELVQVDVVVVDEAGRSVEGLTRADFRVEEEGRPQEIETFETVVAGPAPGPGAPPRPPRVSTNRGDRGEAGRTFAVVFDDLNMTPLRAPAARSAVAELLAGGVRAGDTVLLAATGGGAWWSARRMSGRAELAAQLSRLEGARRPATDPDDMTDWEALRIHVFRDREVAARVQRRFKAYGVTPASDVEREEYRFSFEDPYLLQRASQVYLPLLRRSRLVLGLLERVVSSLVRVAGRKAVILVSEGFVHDPTQPGFEGVLEACARANVAIYFLDVRGLPGMPTATSAQIGPPLLAPDLAATSLETSAASGGAELLASETGGLTVENTNDLGAGIRRLARDAQSYYMLGYRPWPKPPDGGFRAIEVEVARRDVRVRARRGYYAREPDAGTEDESIRSRDFQLALDSPVEWGDIPLRTTALAFGEQEIGRADVLVATEVDLSALAFTERDGRLRDRLEVLQVVAHGDSGEFHRDDHAVDLVFPPEARESVAGEGYVLTRTFALAPGSYQAKLAVRDGNSGKIGTVIHDFEVPDLGVFRTSTPLLTDSVQPDAARRPRPVLVLGREYSPESTLYCEYEVYEAALDETTGMPRVVAGFEVRGSGGETISRVAPTLVRPTSLGRVSRLVAVPLWRLSPGRYELVLRVRDDLAQRELEMREPFSVVSNRSASH